jgi:hypothetical protein
MAPLQKKNFTLDSSGVAGFFGGDEAISAMGTVHIYEGRKWLGWYNSPGSYVVGKKYGQLARSRFWDALFPGSTVDPANLFGLDGTNGPAYIATHSGTVLPDTGHAGHVFLKICQSLPMTGAIEGRGNSTWMVTIAALRKVPDFQIKAANPRQWSHALIASLPMLSSVAGCIGCGVFEDWYCFSMILLGILSSGIACLVIASGTLTFCHPQPAHACPPGDGFLQTRSEFVVLLGEEGAVNTVTRGYFSLEFAGKPECRAIGVAAMLLTTQFLLQLLLIPQGTLLGQILFLSTLAISWIYNCYLSSFDTPIIQGDILAKELGYPVMKRYKLDTRTAAVVFVILALQPPNPSEILDRLLPATETWNIWKRVVGEKMKREEELAFGELDLVGVISKEKGLLEDLFGDATIAYKGYLHYLNSKDIKEQATGIPDESA